jgi:hypothetical protein
MHFASTLAPGQAHVSAHVYVHDVAPTPQSNHVQRSPGTPIPDEEPDDHMCHGNSYSSRCPALFTRDGLLSGQTRAHARFFQMPAQPWWPSWHAGSTPACIQSRCMTRQAAAQARTEHAVFLSPERSRTVSPPRKLPACDALWAQYSVVSACWYRH